MDLIAYYLPQYHPIAENNIAWGEGFTEWTNVTKARRLYPGHYQPKLPADLGFYDLRLDQVKQQQAEMAMSAGITTFSYWYYWLGGGKRLLETPLNQMRRNDNIKIQYCLAWANESWTGVWHGNPHSIIATQEYPENDEKHHARELSLYFSDRRYYRIDGRPVFLVYKPIRLPDQYLHNLKKELRLLGENVYAVAISPKSFGFREAGFDGLNLNRLSLLRKSGALGATERAFFGVLNKTPFSMPRIRGYSRAVATLNPPSVIESDDEIYPTVVPNWDNSPRAGKRALILKDSTPKKYGIHLRQALEGISSRPASRQILFIKSWNEWAEGNYLEPDSRFGKGYIDETRLSLESYCT